MLEITPQQTKEEGLYLIYGRAGTGKTHLANFMAQDGLTAVITFDKSHSVLLDGMRAGRIKVFKLDRHKDFLEKNFQTTLNTLQRDLQPFKYVMFDNISALEQQLLSNPKETLKINDGRQAYQLFQSEMFALAELCIELPAICVVTAWEKEGKSEFGTIPIPDLNAKVLGAFGGLGQAILHTTKQNGAYAINANDKDEQVYIKNRKNNVGVFPSNMIVKFFKTN